MNKQKDEDDLYGVLGVSKDATQEEIKKAYRKLSLQTHPDRNNSIDSTAKYQNINNAYQTLSDETKRADYNMRNNGTRNGNGNGTSPFGNGTSPFGNGTSPFGNGSSVEINPADIFNFLNKNVFEQMGSMNIGGMTFNPMGMNMNMTMDSLKNKLMKPVPIIKTEEIQLSKAYNGCKIPINIKRWVVENGIKNEETETVYLQIPKGVDDNEMLIIRDKGNSLSQNNVGDVKVFIKIINDTCFIRNGLDLILEKTITLKEALCGFVFDLNYIDGRIFKINNNSGNIITNNYNKVISKLGLKRDEHEGNLIINFNVEFPTNLTQSQIESLEKIL
jgi:DnaJ-class molecular chaperone